MLKFYVSKLIQMNFEHQKNIKISDGNDGWDGFDTITIFQKINKN